MTPSARWLLGLAPVFLVLAGCPDPTQPQPLTNLKPQTGPPPVPVPPKPPALPEPEPEADKPKYTAEAAPTRFTLGRHHRAHLDQLPMLPTGETIFDVSHWPVVKYSTGVDLQQGRAPSSLDWPVLLFSRKDAGLAVRFATKRETWPGGAGWLAMVIDAPRTGGIEQLAMAFPNNKARKAKSSIEVGTLAVDSLASFRVRSLADAKTWKLTITSKAQPGEAVLPVIALLPDRLPGVRQVQLDGKPVKLHTAILNPGTYRLSGAAALWMTVPAVDGMKIAELEVELSAL